MTRKYVHGYKVRVVLDEQGSSGEFAAALKQQSPQHDRPYEIGG